MPKKLNKEKSALIFILVLAAFLRLYGINWDNGHLLHPDERFLTMVLNDIKWPASISEYFNTKTSPLNPNNAGYDFFVYGTFPLFLVKALSSISKAQGLVDIVLLGRLTSALFDTGTVLLIYLIAKQLFSNKKALNRVQAGAYLAAFFYAVSVLPIQLSHFFAVDTFLVFFLTLSFYLLLKLIKTLKHKNIKTISLSDHRLTFMFSCFHVFMFVALGIAYGLALASKLSALLFFPVILIGITLQFWPHVRLKLKILPFQPSNTTRLQIFTYVRAILKRLPALTLFCLTTYLTFRIANPYAFASGNILNPTPNPNFVNNIKTLRSWDNPENAFPPAIQWIKTKPIIFPLRNMIYYGLGIPLGALATGGVILTLWQTLKWLYGYMVTWLKNKASKHQNIKTSRLNLSSLTSHFSILLMLIWTLGLFLYQGTQFVKAMRYFAPIYPFLAIFAALFISKIPLFLNSVWTKLS